MVDESDRIVINVGGIAYETYISTLQNIPDTRLAWLTEGLSNDPRKRKEIFFDRHSGVFVHILNYYRTGKLHTPTDICGPLFEEELNFWGIDEKQMEPCCWESFTKHREAEVNLRSFEGPGFEDLKSFKNRNISSFKGQDVMTCRERMDQIWCIMDRPHSSNIAKYTSILSCFMIVLSVTVYCLNTLPSLKNVTAWKEARRAIDISCMCWFTIEFAIRLLVCPDRRSFIKSFSNWIDFLSIIPSYLKLILVKDSWHVNLVIIRLLRLFRFFKLSYGLQVLLHTLKASFYELTLLLLILLIPIVIFSSLVHTIETNLSTDTSTKFISIPATFWWCLITMTSVGYGDMVPETWAGKIIGSMCAICGVLIVALPISVIGSNFSLYYAHVRARLKLPSKDRKLLAGNIRGLLKQPLSLSSRERDRRILKRANLSGLKRKGAARNRVVYNPSFQENQSVSSDLESASESVNQMMSSENCLDWDCTVDSEITFTKKLPSRDGKRKRKGNVAQSVPMSISANGSEEEAFVIKYKTEEENTFLSSEESNKAKVTILKNSQNEIMSKKSCISSNRSMDNGSGDESLSLLNENDNASEDCSENDGCHERKFLKSDCGTYPSQHTPLISLDFKALSKSYLKVLSIENMNENAKSTAMQHNLDIVLKDNAELTKSMKKSNSSLKKVKALQLSNQEVNEINNFDFEDLEMPIGCCSEPSERIRSCINMSSFHRKLQSQGFSKNTNNASDMNELKRDLLPSNVPTNESTCITDSGDDFAAEYGDWDDCCQYDDFKNIKKVSSFVDQNAKMKNPKADLKRKVSQSAMNLNMKNHISGSVTDSFWLRNISSNLRCSYSESKI